MFLRASALAIGATESSMSRNTWSEARPCAFSRKRGLEPGTAWHDRRARSSRRADADGSGTGASFDRWFGSVAAGDAPPLDPGLPKAGGPLFFHHPPPPRPPHHPPPDPPPRRDPIQKQNGPPGGAPHPH